MRGSLTLPVLLLIAAAGPAGEPRAVRPFEDEGALVPENAVDEAVRSALRPKGIEPALPCSDEVFVRRVFLDVIGTLPTPAEVLEFLGDERPDRRARLIDALLERDEFAVYAALRWADVLRVKAEFPINLWPNAVQAYHRWIEDSIRQNRPYDRIAREMLTASGSNFRVPAVNFWRAVQGREPTDLAGAVALTFLGARLDRWPAARRDAMAVFFSRVAYKRTKEWKEEIVFPDPSPGPALDAQFPDGKAVHVPANVDPRVVFADWLVSPRNHRFADVAVNRIWAWLMGRGIVHEPDDFRPDNPPCNPALLQVLSRELVTSGYELRHVYRLILNSATYQQSCIPRSRHPDAERLFAHYAVRRLDAEVLIDAICVVTGTTEAYWSAVPEPFTFVPEDNRSIALSDGSISSPFLEMFGRPTRDTGHWSERGNRLSGAQRLHLLNSSDIQRRIEQGPWLREIARTARRRPGAGIEAVYLRILSRRPTDAELAAIRRHLRGARAAPRPLLHDLAWALINSKEFLYAH